MNNSNNDKKLYKLNTINSSSYNIGNDSNPENYWQNDAVILNTILNNNMVVDNQVSIETNN